MSNKIDNLAKELVKCIKESKGVIVLSYTINDSKHVTQTTYGVAWKIQELISKLQKTLNELVKDDSIIIKPY